MKKRVTDAFVVVLRLDRSVTSMLIKDATGYHAIALLCPNGDKGLFIIDAACTVDEVESLFQIDVYSYLPDEIEESVESQIGIKKWGLR